VFAPSPDGTKKSVHSIRERMSRGVYKDTSFNQEREFDTKEIKALVRDNGGGLGVSNRQE